MTQLALAVDATDELWTLDALPTPEAPYVEVEDELIEVRSRFPSSYYTLTGETLPPRIRVRRGIAGTTKASHIQGSTLTPNYGLGGGAGAGGVTVLEDPGNVWVADSVVAVGYRIGVPNGEYVEVFEAQVGGTTPAAEWEPQLFPVDPNDGQTWWNMPGGQTVDNTVTWVHLGRVGQTPVAAVENQALGTPDMTVELADERGQTLLQPGRIDVVTSKPYGGSGDTTVLLLKRYSAAGVTQDVLIIQDTGDGDYWLRDGGVFAFQLGNGSVRVDEDGMSILGAAAALRFQVAKTGEIYMPTLPTANPNVVGQLWNDAGTLKVSAG